MPTYVYRREDGTTFELEQRISAPALTTDPETGQRVERVISGAGLVFKGSGFYLTDYARKGSATDKAEAKGEGTSDAKGEGKGDAKGDAASEAKPAAPPPPPASSGSSSSGSPAKE
jgi:predicted nucleic acid-binding Zn ribbon protein